MDKEEIINRLEKLSGHVVHVIGEPLFAPSIDDGIALVDAVFLLRSHEFVIEALKSDLNETLAVLGKQPEIVRCKDCKYCSSEIRDGIKFAKCELKHNWMPQPDWFCADGERLEIR